MLNDILAAIPWGILLAFTIGPVFFVLLETSITKGFKAAMVFDLGVVFGDFIFILIAYFSTNQLLEKLKDDPSLFIFGGVIMFFYGLISFIKEKKSKKKNLNHEFHADSIPKNNYLSLFFKGFILNFINIGVLGFWVGIIIVFGPQMNMEPNRITLFLSVIITTYLLTDIVKIVLAKQLKNRLTPYIIYKIKRVISAVLMIFGFFLIVQGFFPKEKEMIKEKIERMNE
jgi:threonine/homoserine/homoserine lactone efflux protein